MDSEISVGFAVSWYVYTVMRVLTDLEEGLTWHVLGREHVTSLTPLLWFRYIKEVR